MREQWLTAWSDAIDEFPATGSVANRLIALVPFAVLAPSSHNSQPWLFRISCDTLELYADRIRRLPVVDPDDRALVISCGAALGCLEVAMRHFGYRGIVELTPEPAQPDLLARVRLGGEFTPTELDHELFAAISRRHTHRLPFAGRPPDAALLSELESIAEQEGTWFRILQAESSRLALAEMISEGDRLQMADPLFREELAAWMRPTASRDGDGMPGYSHGFGAVTALLAPLVIRTFDIGDGQAARHRDIALNSPVLAVLGTDSPSTGALLRTGRSLIRILLRAEISGVSTSFLNQPIEVPSLRLRLISLLGRSGFPQLILRMGYPLRPGQPTPRRAVAQVLL